MTPFRSAYNELFVNPMQNLGSYFSSLTNPGVGLQPSTSSLAPGLQPSSISPPSKKIRVTRRLNRENRILKRDQSPGLPVQRKIRPAISFQREPLSPSLPNVMNSRWYQTHGDPRLLDWMRQQYNQQLNSYVGPDKSNPINWV